MGSLAVSSHLPPIQNVCAAPAAIHTHRDLTTQTPLAVTDRPPIGFSAGGKATRLMTTRVMDQGWWQLLICQNVTVPGVSEGAASF